MSKTQPLHEIEKEAISWHRQIKAEHSDAIVFVKVTDFYQTYDDDARQVAKLLQLTLLFLDAGEPEHVPACALPAHSFQQHFKECLLQSHKVVIVSNADDSEPPVSKQLIGSPTLQRWPR